ncbi:MAG TPA: SMP-30/gluconolactonase/LRE family protein, partial [Candidatus Binataceae bacterium]|nr:SMP-30/gluconolactonase/LRE family protein [Candidatus Binataceae bacterium]
MDYIELKPLVDDGKYFEGPRWHDGKLWFVDSLARKLLRVELDGACETICEIPGIAGGIGFLPNGDVVITSMFDRKLLTFAGGGKVSTL